MLRSVNLNVKPSKMKIKLAKPNREPIRNIVHFTKTPTLKLSLGRLNEISFTIPYMIDKNHELVENEVANLIRNRYLLKVRWNHVSEWFVINDIEDSVDDGSEGIVVHAFSLGHELADKLILELNETSLLPEQILTKALSTTSWSVGTIDPKIINKFRSFDVSETSVLNFLYTIADTFGVLITFDTENQKVNLVHPDNYKINRGFKVAYGQYLKSLTRNSNSDDMTTRLIVTGKDGLSINKVNPTGANYIESFSYFMYPFERDTNRNVLQSSDFMSDGLCHAILDYEAKVESHKDEFSDLLTQLDTKQQLKATKEDELFTLETDLQIIIDEIEIRKAANVSYSDLITQRNAKKTEVDNKKAEIATVQTDIDTIYARIDAIKLDLAIENNFTPEQIIEKNRYIIIKKWSDENYIDDKELYEDAKVKFDDVRKPKLNMQTGVVNFFQMIEEQRNWDKLYLGDVVTVRHPRIKASYEVFVTDIEVSEDNLNLTIADYQEIRKDEALLEKINKSYSSSISVDMSKYKWNETSENLGEINDLINNAWNAAKRRIIAGVKESVEISNRGIIIKNPDFPNEMLVAQSGVLALSKDAGETWKTAITPSHIVAEVIMGRLIAGENLIIENSEGKFTFDQNGATIQGNSFNVIGGTNGVEIDSDTGLTVTKSDKKVRTKLNATDGIKIQSSADNGVSWVDKFYADTNGIIHARGLKILSSDGSEVLIDGENKIIDFSKFISILGKVKAENIQIGAETIFADGYDPSTKETPEGAMAKADSAGQAVRDDLRQTSPLPISLTMNQDGITASTSDPSRYARLDDRGLFVKNGAVQIERPDGALFIQDGLAKMDFAIQPSYPADLINTSQGTRHYVSERSVSQNDGYIGLYTFRKVARYLEFEVALSSSTVSYAAIFKVIESGSNTHLGSISSTEALGNETVKKLRIDMGIPDFSEYAVRALLLHNFQGATAYCRIIRIRQTDF